VQESLRRCRYHCCILPEAGDRTGASFSHAQTPRTNPQRPDPITRASAESKPTPLSHGGRSAATSYPGPISNPNPTPPPSNRQPTMSAPVHAPLSGGCLCGSVRYTIHFPSGSVYPPTVRPRLLLSPSLLICPLATDLPVHAMPTHLGRTDRAPRFRLAVTGHMGGSRRARRRHDVPRVRVLAARAPRLLQRLRQLPHLAQHQLPQRDRCVHRLHRPPGAR